MATFERISSIADGKINNSLSKHIIDYKELFNNVEFDEDGFEVFEYIPEYDLRLVGNAHIKSEGFNFDGRLCIRIVKEPYRVRKQSNKETYIQVYFIHNNELCGIVNLNFYESLNGQQVMCNIYKSRRLVRYIDPSLLNLAEKHLYAIMNEGNPYYHRITLDDNKNVVEENIKLIDVTEAKVKECVDFAHARYDSVAGFQRGLR